MSLLTDDIRRKPERTDKKLLKLISDYNNTAGYKVKIQKSIVFLYINN